MYIGTVSAMLQGGIAGVVTDSLSREPLPYVNIFIAGTGKGTVTDLDGRYLLKLPEGIYIITYSMVGYQTEKREVVVTSGITDVDITFKRAQYEIPEVVVTGENPGVLIMRNAIKRKLEQKEKLRTYQYNLYTKFIVSTDTVTARRSTERGDTTIFSIFESYSTGYYAQPDKYFNKIVQRRQSVNVPPQANFVAFGTNINIYDDYVTIIGEEIATPFHPDAIDYYDFVLENWYKPDSLTMTARIKVTPKSGLRKLFIGYVDIDGAEGMPYEVKLLPNEAVKLPFNASLEFRQTFSETEGMVIPAGMHIRSIVPVDIYWIFDARIDVSIYTVAYDYAINIPLDNELFEQRRVEIDKGADSFDAAYWNDNAVMPLREEEKFAYEEIRRIRENPDSVLQATFIDRYIGPLTRQIAKLDRPPFTGFDDFFRFNRVQGVYLGGGYRFFEGEDISTVVKAGYSLADKKTQGELQVNYRFDEFGKAVFSAGIYNRINRRDNPYFLSEQTITLLSLLSKSDYGDYYYSSGFNGEFTFSTGQLRFIKRDLFERPYLLRIGYRDETHLSAEVSTNFSVFGRKKTYRPNPPAHSGRLRAIYTQLNLNYSPSRRIGNLGLSLEAEFTGPKILKSDFNYSQYKTAFYLRTTTLPLWTLDINVTGGYASGNLPAQRYHSFESSTGGFATAGAFRGLKEKEYYGDRFATVSMEHNFGELIPGLIRIPDIASFGVEVIAYGGAGWSDFHDANTVQMNYPYIQATSQTADRIYYEAGVGFNRLFLFFRFDISARLSQVSGPAYSLTFSTATN